MKETKKYAESRQLHIEGFIHESKVELEDNGKAPSISLTSAIGNNGRKLIRNLIIYKNLGFLKIKHGSLLIQEKGIGESPIALS